MNTDYGWICAGFVYFFKAVEVDPSVSGLILTEFGVAISPEGCLTVCL